MTLHEYKQRHVAGKSELRHRGITIDQQKSEGPGMCSIGTMDEVDIEEIFSTVDHRAHESAYKSNKSTVVSSRHPNKFS
jgi:hypothetical protein